MALYWLELTSTCNIHVCFIFLKEFRYYRIDYTIMPLKSPKQEKKMLKTYCLRFCMVFNEEINDNYSVFL